MVRVVFHQCIDRLTHRHLCRRSEAALTVAIEQSQILEFRGQALIVGGGGDSVGRIDYVEVPVPGAGLP